MPNHASTKRRKNDFQKRMIERLQSKLQVQESRNKLLRAEVERLTHGEQPAWTPFQPAAGHVLGDGRVASGPSHSDRTGSYLVFLNSRYTVTVYRPAFIRGDDDVQAGDWYHLSIKRNDGAAIHDWRDLQRIKNEIVGPEHEGIELYPAESRLTDGANQYHIHVLTDSNARIPVGFGQRLVSESQSEGVQQRPWPDGEKPEDLQVVTAATLAEFSGSED